MRLKEFGALAFVDVAGFSAHIAGKTPKQIREFLDEYYTEVIPNATPGFFNATQTTALVSVRLDGSDKRTHAKITTGKIVARSSDRVLAAA